MITKKIKQKPTQIRISEYQEVFYIISVLSKKYVYLNMPKRYKFWHLYSQIEVGIKYDRDDEYTQCLYFAPNGCIGYSFMSFNTNMSVLTYNLEDILDYLDTPTQILTNFYLRLFAFSKERKKKIQGLRGALHFLKIILENEDDEYRT